MPPEHPRPFKFSVQSFFKKKEWLVFRQRCIEKAGFHCERCSKEGVLQIHHPEYAQGRKPWEYPIESCEVLCRGCHAAEHGKILPRDGWIILFSDLENNEPSEPIPCANCQSEITWHFHIYHPDWGEAVVGSECAENLSLGVEVADLKRYQARLRTFIHSPRWKATKKGWRIERNDYQVLAYKRTDGCYRLIIDNIKGRQDYATLLEAKQRAFEVIERKLI